MIYLTPPENFKPKFAVTACFCEINGNFLFLKRNPNKPQGNTWCLPAGKIENGENPKDAVIRETFEETAIKLKKDNVHLIKKVYVRYPEFDFDYYMFKTIIKENNTKIKLSQEEHLEFKIINIDDALKLDLIPGEDKCIELIYDKLIVKKHNFL